jgi:hypothetical protein
MESLIVWNTNQSGLTRDPILLPVKNNLVSALAREPVEAATSRLMGQGYRKAGR